MVEVRFINDTTPIEVTSEEQETQIGVVSETQATEIQVGVLTHADLSGRELPDQHPIGAITGLQDTLDDCVDDAELEAALLEKQDTLTAGANIQIVGNTISATDTTYTAGTGIDITNGVISNTQTSAIWGNITGTLSAQTDLQNALNAKANTADIPTATSDLLNDSGFITLSALTPYATQTWVENKGYLTEIPAEYVTDSELTAKGYQTAADVETAITAKGYITNAALVGYATESYVTTAVGTEITNRQNADNNLQSQIDAITASSDVTDIVGTYAELQSYDTSTLPPNSIIKVLQDESRNNETTYYRWVITGGVGTWSLIGEEGPYYTKSEADAKFATQTALSTGLSGKQDTISDLATIRSGAALGATAVQPSDLATVATSGSYNDLSNKPTIPAAQVNADWNANSGVTQILNKPTIPTVNNATITLTQGGTTKGSFTLNQSGNSTIDFDMGGSSVEPDESSINFNSANKLQSVGFINARTGSAMRLWEGTESQWNNGETRGWFNWKNLPIWQNGTGSLPTYSGNYGHIAYGNGMFAVVNGSTTVFTSTDGRTWSTVSAPGGYNVSHIAFGNNKFALVTSDGKYFITTEKFVGSSTSDISWVTSSTSCKSLRFLNGNFYLTLFNGNILKKTESGTNLISTNQNQTINDITYEDGLYVVVGGNGGANGGIILTSSDESTWTEVYTKSGYFNRVTYGNGTFVAIDDNSAYISADGSNWQKVSILNSETGYNYFNSMSEIIYANNKFIIVGYGKKIATSADGSIWVCDTISAGSQSSVWGIIYGNNILVIPSYNQVLYLYDGSPLSQYTTNENPTTSDILYSTPNTVSALTITSVDTSNNQLVLSDGNIYGRNSTGDQTITRTVSEVHPDWICMIEGVGIKKGTTTISTANTVDQTYNATSTNAQSGVAVASGIADSLGDIESALSEV